MNRPTSMFVPSLNAQKLVKIIKVNAKKSKMKNDFILIESVNKIKYQNYFSS
jgi:hypothetical protein